MTKPAAAPRVAFLPYGFRLKGALADVPLADLFWPFGRPAGQQGGTIADLAPHDHLILYPAWRLIGLRHRRVRARLSILFVEPRALYGHFMWLAARMHGRFHAILTSDGHLNATLPNAVFLPFGGCWVPEWKDLDTTKTKKLSLIASAKRSLDGHKLRHRVVRWLVRQGIDADVMGRGYRPFASKAEGLAPYRFSVVIENASERDYFTEKLIDAFMCRTIPIYWGCPNIGDYFDTSGMIICRDIDEITRAITAIDEDTYFAMVPAAEANLRKACAYHDFQLNAAKALLTPSPRRA